MDISVGPLVFLTHQYSTDFLKSKPHEMTSFVIIVLNTFGGKVENTFLL